MSTPARTLLHSSEWNRVFFALTGLDVLRVPSPPSGLILKSLTFASQLHLVLGLQSHGAATAACRSLELHNQQQICLLFITPFCFQASSLTVSTSASPARCDSVVKTFLFFPPSSHNRRRLKWSRREDWFCQQWRERTPQIQVLPEPVLHRFQTALQHHQEKVFFIPKNQHSHSHTVWLQWDLLSFKQTYSHSHMYQHSHWEPHPSARLLQEEASWHQWSK